MTGPPKGAKYPTPAGGLYSTAADLARVYQMMLRHGVLDHRRYLSKSSVEEMTRVQTGDLKAGFTEGTGWGLGWGVVREPKGVTGMLSPGSYGHGGAWGTQAWIDPEKNRFVVILFQRAGLKNSDESEIRRSLQQAAFGDR
ncbi:MAG: beta-lactamase family protein [Planctomycetia bacterium]|nr:beta-lactamase family protein [Planctomycetia bacterium]